MLSLAKLSLILSLLNGGLVLRRCSCTSYSQRNAGLTSIPWAVIPPDVQTIDLFGNNIVDTGLFPETPNLDTVHISSNRINVFPQLSNVASQIVVLNLGHNDLTFVPADELNALTSLEYLFLDNNPLQQFPDVPGPGESLRRLTLNGALFTEFPSLVNIGARLELLYIHENMITEVNANMLPFSHDVSMTLQLGSLNTIQMDLSNFALWNVWKLSLFQVSITCDCRVIWLKLMEEAGVIIYLEAEPCDSPAELVNVSWTDIGIDDLVCKSKCIIMMQSKSPDYKCLDFRICQMRAI